MHHIIHTSVWHPDGSPYERRCAVCSATMSLGPANDTPEVLVELRAAELAQAAREGREDATWADEDHEGWWANRHGVTPQRARWWAGWLAREIWVQEHEVQP